MKLLTHFCAWSSITILWSLPSGETTAATTYRLIDTLEIDTVPSAFPVRFSLLTHENRQFVAYYNQRHQLVVAQRQLDQRPWHKVTLPSEVGWDSHNYITLAIDAAGQLHVAGNMHCVPLIYFRTTRPGDVTTLKRQAMTGQDERRCTYPRFLTGADGRLLFMYRSGSSGNGRRLCNIYDDATQRWTRFLDAPLLDGEDRCNAYPLGPLSGPDGLFHLVWVWRDTPDCATNHHLSYARSHDLREWETAAGRPVTLPLTLEQSALCVDPVPAHGGIINGCEHLTFDVRHRPIISYHKLDDQGFMQVYVARFQDGRWAIHPITHWKKRITFGGGGAMPFIGISVSALKPLAPNRFYITYRHRDYGLGTIVLDQSTLQPVDERATIPAEFPAELRRPTSDFPGMQVRLAEDRGGLGGDTRYMLRWETLGANHDRPRQPPLPDASRLQLVTLKRNE